MMILNKTFNSYLHVESVVVCPEDVLHDSERNQQFNTLNLLSHCNIGNNKPKTENHLYFPKIQMQCIVYHHSLCFPVETVEGKLLDVGFAMNILFSGQIHSLPGVNGC